MFSLGKTPYPGIQPGQELYDKLLDNYRMSRPQFCPHNVYKIMYDCWNAEPKQRPRFSDLSVILGNLLGEVEKEHYMKLERQVSSGVRSQLLDMMASPEYMAMTTISHGVPLSEPVTSDVVVAGDGYLAPDIIINTGHNMSSNNEDVPTDNGYLVPNITINDNSDTLPSNGKLHYTKI